MADKPKVDKPSKSDVERDKFWRGIVSKEEQFIISRAKKNPPILPLSEEALSQHTSYMSSSTSPSHHASSPSPSSRSPSRKSFPRSPSVTSNGSYMTGVSCAGTADTSLSAADERLRRIEMMLSRSTSLSPSNKSFSSSSPAALSPSRHTHIPSSAPPLSPSHRK
eukprot:GILI01044952.1.p1 GENE.GILI01044952.1~~GILI01044952.1.p1  ORF type:complete len:178 (-),score=28.21 GILI01044952.1:54-548(-)